MKLSELLAVLPNTQVVTVIDENGENVIWRVYASAASSRIEVEMYVDCVTEDGTGLIVSAMAIDDDAEEWIVAYSRRGLIVFPECDYQDELDQNGNCPLKEIRRFYDEERAVKFTERETERLKSEDA